MRILGILVCLCFVVSAAAGCKNKGADANAAPDPAAVKAQQELVARREALLAEQKKMQEESKVLEVKIEEAKQRGEAVDELAKKKEELDKKIQGSETELDTTADQLTNLTSKLDAAAGVAAREARVAEREARIALREKEFADSLKSFAKTQDESARRWQEQCSSGAPMIIQQVAPPKGGNYSRKEVDTMMSRARGAMAKKGLISSDLGPQASLESEVTKAMQDSDFARAFILANQLVQTIDAIQVNRTFINAKYQRLHTRVKSAKVDEPTQAKLTAGMQEVMQKYGDGDFTSANRRINQLWGDLK